VQAIEQLALKGPFELRMVQIPRMDLEIVRMHGDVRVLEFYDDFDAFPLLPRVEVEQRMLVEAELGQYAIEAWFGRLGH